VLTWIDNSSDETSFRIESRRSTQIFFEEAGFVSANVTTATIASVEPGTTYSFRIRARNSRGDSPYSSERTVTTPTGLSSCQTPAVCFAGNRFKVEARWQILDGASGAATVIRLTEDTGALWFFSSSNIETVFKVLNACQLNNSFWFFAGGLTNVQTVITITDVNTGTQKVYTNPQGVPFRAIQDTEAFKACP
jgi:hypothetical protein